MSFLGDSITAYSLSINTWAYKMGAGYPAAVIITNHAASSATIASELAGQVTASASDNADIIFICLGTNDDNGGDMGALQSTFETALSDLKTSNSGATIYVLNVLPKFTDASAIVEVDKGNIRTAVAAACTAQSVTCWDTYTIPWLGAGLMQDGTHPNAAGHAAIAAEVLALL